ncbi:short-chain dehydrogenase [Burkholderia diffusa]|uniref:Short-chain dehydrogenase n=2 Tax=Burkholderia diffusa TaxID=488732 RepID=A0AAW3PA58_9BURK|nr:short-chain dehydrogenase [Burkholderia diffusa]KWF38886.1 short-chain dehydrogenase [Burkholderia diffusa]KWF46933.1 short-chain dehydrogenase [Burkholderia diffusa]KWF50788.1 short-chain dehydrogenase [Burkholderia diffusa]
MMQGLRLKDKVALITGGGGGIGAAMARVFCGEGASVVLVDANSQALDVVANDLRASDAGGRVCTFVADVADEEQAGAAAALAVRTFGRLDVLVNNAAMRDYSSLVEATPEDWRRVVAVNLIGASNYSKAALPHLRAAGAGSIVNVSSCYAVTGRKGMGLYDATKAGMLAMTRTLAFEEAVHGVRVNAVCPGSTLTDFHVNRAREVGKSVEVLKTQRQDTSLIGRWASPDEIAWPILWLASDEASFITGTTLMVDGGLSIM